MWERLTPSSGNSARYGLPCPGPQRSQCCSSVSPSSGTPVTREAQRRTRRWAATKSRRWASWRKRAARSRSTSVSRSSAAGE
ncbi:hypothetical protein ACFQ08_10985 [Streptosporangium algeriense]|uniref:Uncharacterized protein n=1 Tax=Streptosporangium algeriense TaxID=1682748 RepID=A0ABW3DML1_9ACTN